MKRIALFAALLVQACAASAEARDQTIDTQTGPVRIETVAGGLSHPWAIAFLPDGSMLVTEREGRLRRVGRDGQLSAPLAGVPAVFAQGQGGLLDVAIEPAFADSRMVYLSYAEPGEGGAGTA
jgi:aldose sugar dehydrogenase